MMQLILGRSGSGKTKYLLDDTAALARAGAAVVLLVPEQFSFETERAILRLLGPRDMARVEVLSFTRLVDSFRRAYGGGGLEPVGEAERALLMSRAVDAVSDSLEVYAKSADSPEFVRELIALSARCRQSGVRPERLRSVAGELESGLLKDKSHELSLILEAYDTLVSTQYTEPLDALDRLASALDEHPYFAGKTVAVDAFKSFTAQEYAVLSRILRQAEEVKITLCTDSVGEAGACSRFAVTSATARRLVRLAGSCGVPVHPAQYLREGVRFLEPELSALEENLFEPSGFVFDGPAEHVTLYQAYNRAGECDYTAREIKRLLREEGYRCREIAVVMRDEEAYMRPLMGALGRYGVPLFEDRRSSVASQPLMVFVRCALKIAAGGFDTDSLMRYAKSGVCGVERDDISVLENYAVMWNIRYAQWKRPFERHPRGLETEFTNADTALLGRIEQTRLALVEPLLAFTARAREGSTGRAIATATYELLQRVGAAENLLRLARAFESRGEVELALEQERVWDILMDLLGAFGTIYENEQLGVQKFLSLFEIVVSLQTLGNIPQGLDNITIAAADRARLGSPRAVFLLGVNEGVFPAAASEGGLFTDPEYRILQGRGIELGGVCEDRALEERFTTYCAASAARERLYICYAQADAKGEGLSPSVLVDECRRILPACVKMAQGAEAAIDRIESGKSALALYAETAGGNSSVRRALELFLEPDPAYAGTVEAIRRSAAHEDAVLKDPVAAEKLFGKNMLISASRVETYYQCPFQYYCRYGLKAMPRTAAQLDAMRSGTAIHYVLEHIIRELGAGGLSALRPDERLSLVEKYLYRYREEFMGGEASLTARDRYAFATLVRTVYSLINRIAQELSECSFEPADFELEIGGEGEIPPYTVTLSDGSTLRIQGKVDRVDICRRGNETLLRVIDYKSGAKEFRLCDVMQGLNIQMVLYLMCIARGGAEHYGGRILPAGVLYLSSRGPDKNLGRHATDREVLEKEDRAYRMSGMVLDDAQVILAMEHDGTGKFIPAGVDDTHKTFGSVISSEQFRALSARIDGLLRQMGEGLHQGQIRAYPAYSKTHDKICEYCDYRDICRDDGSRKRVLEELDHSKCLAELKEGGDGHAAVDTGTEKRN